AAKVALISETFWRERFNGSNTVLGQQISLNGVPREIIGVVPETVRFPRASNVFTPLADLRADKDILNRGNHAGFSGLGRLKDNVTLAQAAADLDNIAQELERRYPPTNAARRVNARLLLESVVGPYRQTLFLLLGAVVCVLLIACANVASLQLVRALSRRKEFAVRAALGASRWRTAFQLGAESALLTAIGGAAGVLVALWSLDAIVALCPPNVTRFHEAHIDWTVLGFTAAVVALAALVVGVWPAYRISSNASLTRDLHDGGARGSSEGVRSQRARGTLVIMQVALAVILLAAAGLTLESFRRAQQVPLGFDPNNVLTLGVVLPAARYDSPPKITSFYAQLVQRVGVLPGVEAAAIGSNIPFDDGDWDSSFHITGTPPSVPGQEPAAEDSAISGDYFRVLGMPIIRGRTFGPQDVAGQPMAVLIDESFARRFFLGVDPIGQHIDDNESPGENLPPLTVIGVVPRTRNEPAGEGVEARNLPQMYFCAAQLQSAEQVLLVRAAPGIDPASLILSIKRELAGLDPEQAISEPKTLEQRLNASLAPRRLATTLFGVFAGLALTLASVGLYGVMSLSVTQRTRELGIRLALGAARWDLFRLVLTHGMMLVGAGLLIGLLGTLGAARGLSSVLYGIGASDPTALLGAMVALAIVALAACWLPARRATRLDPIIALRSE
ncbi:MAG TPA: ADOP family duplicated permease, partial [Chthoniobacterales bacterium]|nr:ADOP family duplicated permease [Chthoniobacterales bacterium]